MKILILLVISMLFILAPASVEARYRQPKPLTYVVTCLNANGAYGARITGAGTVDQPIDWANNPNFNPLANHGDNRLEGDTGVFGFTITEFPNGVWIRWSNFPRVITYIPVPPACSC